MLKDPKNRYIKNPQTHPKASLRQNSSGAGRKFCSKVSKSNTLPIQIYSTLVEKSEGTTSVGLWFQNLLEGKCDDQQNLKDILEATLLSNLEGFTYISPNVHMTSSPVKKPNASKSLCLFTNILDVQLKTARPRFVLQQNQDAKP